MMNDLDILGTLLITGNHLNKDELLRGFELAKRLTIALENRYKGVNDK